MSIAILMLDMIGSTAVLGSIAWKKNRPIFFVNQSNALIAQKIV
jgi:hypothetical protein